MKLTYIYVISERPDRRLGGRLAVKVGVARNPQRRCKELQTANPRKLDVTLVIGPMSEKMAFRLEAKIHRYLHRYRLNGEWFQGVSISKLKNFTLPANVQVNVIDPTCLHSKRQRKRWNKEKAATEALDMQLLANSPL